MSCKANIGTLQTLNLSQRICHCVKTGGPGHIFCVLYLTDCIVTCTCISLKSKKTTVGVGVFHIWCYIEDKIIFDSSLGPGHWLILTFFEQFKKYLQTSQTFSKIIIINNDYSSPPLIRTPHLPKSLSVLERCPLVRGSTKCIHSTCWQEFVPFMEGCPLKYTINTNETL